MNTVKMKKDHGNFNQRKELFMRTPSLQVLFSPKTTIKYAFLGDL